MRIFSRFRSTPAKKKPSRPEDRGLKVRFEQLEPRAMMKGDAILHWNQIALDAVAADHTYANYGQQLGPTRTSRALAMVHTAMFDAINSIKGKFSPYMVHVLGAQGANIDAAVGKAARDVLASLYSDQKKTFNKEMHQWRADIPDGRAKRLGIQVGKAVAEAILASRRRDGANRTVNYQTVDALGRHQPDPLNPNQGFLDPHWGNVKTFGIPDAKKFLPPKPPSLDSQAYTRAYNEVKKYGGDGVTTPTIRTQEQTNIGLFWAYDATQGLCAPPRLYNQIAVTIAKGQGNTEYENARMLALVNVAMADAAIVGWDCKYVDDFWRPVIGIREGDFDGNDKTAGDANWTPLGAPASNQTFPNDFSPPFPAYVSGHAIIGASMFRSIARFYGTDNISFSFTSDEFNGTTTDSNGVVRPEITRSFNKLSDAAEENAQSRIYLGIHWRFDKVFGLRAGNKIANYLYRNVMSPVVKKKMMPVPMMISMVNGKTMGSPKLTPAKMADVAGPKVAADRTLGLKAVDNGPNVRTAAEIRQLDAMFGSAGAESGSPAAQDALDGIFEAFGSSAFVPLI